MHKFHFYSFNIVTTVTISALFCSPFEAYHYRAEVNRWFIGLESKNPLSSTTFMFYLRQKMSFKTHTETEI